MTPYEFRTLKSIVCKHKSVSCAKFEEQGTARSRDPEHRDLLCVVTHTHGLIFKEEQEETG